MLSARLESLFRIRPGEGRLVAMLVALMFFPAAGFAIGSSGITALFLCRIGAKSLPYMYIMLGVVTLVVMLTITTLLGRVSRKRLYLSLPLALVLALVGARILVRRDLNWFYPALWLAMFLIRSLQNLLTWGLAGMVCNTRQAKRLFPLFGAGGILGGALGGLLTKPLVGWLGTENLLLAWAVMLLGTFVLVRVLTSGVDDVRSLSRHQHSRLTDDLQQGYRFVRRSALMRWMSLAFVLFSVLYFSLWFPFDKDASDRFSGQEDALAGFLGVFNGVTTGVAFLVLLFLANRLYARFGLMDAILVFPVIYLLGFGVLAAATQETFSLLVAFRFFQMLWLQGIVDTALQAVFNIIPPERREQTRSFINGVQQAGIALSGVLLAVVKPQQMYYVGIGAALLTIFVFWRARYAYSGALVEALRAGHPHVFFGEERPFGGFNQDAAAVATVVTGISDPDPKVRSVSAEILGNLAVPEATQALVNALDDSNVDVRSALLCSLARAGASPALLDVAVCLNDPEPQVRLQAVTALRDLAGYPKGLITHIQPLLGDTDPAVRSSVAVALLQTGPHPKAAAVLQTMIQADEIESRVRALEGFAAWGDASAYEPAVAGLADPHLAVRRVAASALARIGTQQCIEPLVNALGDEDQLVRKTVAAAIGTIGAPALECTVEALSDPTLEAGALAALGHLSAHPEAETIREYARNKVSKVLYYDELWRGFAFSGNGGDRMSLLTTSLQNSARRHGINALRATALLGNRDLIALAIDNLGSADPHQRANALEMLDSIGDHEVIRPLLPLWESSAVAPAGTNTRDVAATSLTTRLLHVLQDGDAWLRACAALAAGGVDDPQIRAELAQLAQSDPDADVRKAAATALKGGFAVETLTTLPLMERILFLHRVPLFAHLPPAELKQVARIMSELFFVDGQVITRQDDLGDEMYIIVSGEVVAMISTDEGAKVELGREGPGACVGEMAIISREPRMASLIAVGDVRALCIGREQFDVILRERPETSRAVMRVLCARLRDTAQKLGGKGERVLE